MKLGCPFGLVGGPGVKPGASATIGRVSPDTFLRWVPGAYPAGLRTVRLHSLPARLIGPGWGWKRDLDSNQGPPGYEPGALLTAPSRYVPGAYPAGLRYAYCLPFGFLGQGEP